MGKSSPPKGYRDDPDAVSMHTTPDDYEYAGPASNEDGLPSYTDSEATATSSNTDPASARRASSTAHIDDTYAIVQPSGNDGWRVNSDVKATGCGEVTMRMDERLNEPAKLHDYITDYLRVVPPKPTVRIQGWHQETVRRKNKKEKERVCDFDVLLSLQPYLGRVHNPDWWSEQIIGDSDNTYRGSWRKARAPGHKQGVQLTDEPTPTLLDWCESYCASPSKLKVFRVNRLVQGLNTAILKQEIEQLIRKTHYRGHMDISFPVEQKAVDIYNPHIVNSWRNNWVRYIFYFTFLWIFTWPILFFMTKWWECYTVVWNWSYVTPGGQIQYATLSEKQWFTKHEALIRNLVVNKYQGDASSHPTHFAAAPVSRTPSTGSANVDSAIGFVQGGVGVWNALSSGRSPGDQSWGYDC